MRSALTLATLIRSSAGGNHALSAEQLLAQHAAAKLSAAGAQAIASAPPAGDAEFVRALGTQLMLNDKAFRWVGANV